MKVNSLCPDVLDQILLLQASLSNHNNIISWQTGNKILIDEIHFQEIKSLSPTKRNNPIPQSVTKTHINKNIVFFFCRVLNFKQLDQSFYPSWANGNVLLAYRTLQPLAGVTV